MSVETVLPALRKEINSMLIFFIETDMRIYGAITPETVSAFRKQKVDFPEVLNQFLKE